VAMLNLNLLFGLFFDGVLLFMAMMAERPWCFADESIAYQQLLHN